MLNHIQPEMSLPEVKLALPELGIALLPVASQEQHRPKLI